MGAVMNPPPLIFLLGPLQRTYYNCTVYSKNNYRSSILLIGLNLENVCLAG